MESHSFQEVQRFFDLAMNESDHVRRLFLFEEAFEQLGELESDQAETESDVTLIKNIRHSRIREFVGTLTKARTIKFLPWCQYMVFFWKIENEICETLLDRSELSNTYNQFVRLHKGYLSGT